VTISIKKKEEKSQIQEDVEGSQMKGVPKDINKGILRAEKNGKQYTYSGKVYADNVNVRKPKFLDA